MILGGDVDITLCSSDSRLITFNTSLVKTKTTNNTQGMIALTCKNARTVTAVGQAEDFLGGTADPARFYVDKLPSAGILQGESDQKSLFD